jgi:hypothetical protein
MPSYVIAQHWATGGSSNLTEEASSSGGYCPPNSTLSAGPHGVPGVGEGRCICDDEVAFGIHACWHVAGYRGIMITPPQQQQQAQATPEEWGLSNPPFRGGCRTIPS